MSSVINVRPVAGDDDVELDAKISFDFADANFDLLDLNSVVVHVNGVIAYQNSLQHNGFTVSVDTITHGFHFDITPPAPWTANQLVTVSVDGTDADFVPVINPISNLSVPVGVFFSISPTVLNPQSIPILSYSADNLPTGTSIDTSTGEISGTISGDGVFNNVQVHAVYGGPSPGVSDSNTFTIDAYTAPSINSISDQTGTQNVAFSFTPSVVNPDLFTLAWSVMSGTLPTSMSINAGTGNISGTDASAETKTGIVLRASYVTLDGVTHHADSNSFQINVLPQLLTPPNIASGATVDFSSWYDAQSFDANLNTGVVDGASFMGDAAAPLTQWKDLGPDARHAAVQNLISAPGNIVYRATGGPAGAKPCIEWVAQNTGSNPAFEFKSLFAQETVPKLTILLVLKTNLTGEREIFCTGVDDYPAGSDLDKINIETPASTGDKGFGLFRGAQLTESTVPQHPMTAWGYVIFEINGVSSRIIFSDGTIVSGNAGAHTTIRNYFIGSYNGQVANLSYLGKMQTIVVYKDSNATLTSHLQTYGDAKLAGS